MRPTTGTMLQQNNNNNYPCLDVSGSTRDLVQKCSRAALPFPSRLELGLGDLPLIRGLRAWALCSKNRRKPGGPLGGGAGQAPMVPPPGRGGSNSCPRPADVYLSGEWGRMGYGMPLGLDARQAGIGALVTVATLKTSEGSGKTQTQCLFLRTEKGSCLYSTAKPGGGGSSAVGGWLRGKTRGGRDALAGNGPPAPIGANRARVRSGRRWRKSGNAAAGREKTCKEREDPAEERQEEQDKGGPDAKQGVCRTPGSCLDESPKTCGRSAMRRDDHEEHDEGESPSRGDQRWLNGTRKERQEDMGESNGFNPEEGEPEKTQGSHHDDVRLETDEDRNTRSRHDRGFGKPVEEVGTKKELEQTMERLDVQDEEEVEVTSDICPSSVNASSRTEPSESETCGVHGEHQDRDENPGIQGQEGLDLRGFETPDVNFVVEQEEEAENENEKNEDGREDPLSNRMTEIDDETEPQRNSKEESHVESTCDGLHMDADKTEATNCASPRLINDEDEDEDEDGSRQTSVGYVLTGAESGSCTTKAASADPSTSLDNPAPPSLPPLGSMATGLPCMEAEEEEQEEEEWEEEGGNGAAAEGGRWHEEEELERPEEEEQRPEEEEEDEFGVFMQAEEEEEEEEQEVEGEEPAWGEGFSMSASVPCGSVGANAISVESSHWAPGWTDSSFHQSDDGWTAFPQDSSDGGGDGAGQWWPISAVEEKRDRILANQNLASVFANAFPSPTTSDDPRDPQPVPTLTQLLRGTRDQDQGLLDSFHDLNRMIVQRNQRVGGVSRDHLLKTLQLQPPPHAETRPGPWMANRRLSPGLPSANQHAAAKRRLSYDYNRNVVE
ncbi:retinitis pigmentosa 1-like 1 protein [Sphaeramia orbicularis]|uniref:retinitis pigmentosa 1-like 1 protein n=1 Tax=Sphaeramia orbicularis TaxID=375764 RepID=UPI00117D0D3A|nr:retinitis pigmentosa 1-like 1 protein [Sphaeramia orbicularis]